MRKSKLRREFMESVASSKNNDYEINPITYHLVRFMHALRNYGLISFIGICFMSFVVMASFNVRGETAIKLVMWITFAYILLTTFIPFVVVNRAVETYVDCSKDFDSTGYYNRLKEYKADLGQITGEYEAVIAMNTDSEALSFADANTYLHLETVKQSLHKNTRRALLCSSGFIITMFAIITAFRNQQGNMIRLLYTANVICCLLNIFFTYFMLKRRHTIRRAIDRIYFNKKSNTTQHEI